MKKFVFFVLMLVMLTFPMCGCAVLSWQAPRTQERPNLPADYAVDPNPQYVASKNEGYANDVVKKVFPSTVGIVATSLAGQSVGSGVCVASEGYILTNQHVVDGSNSVTLYFSDNTSCSASVVWSDKNIDLAIVKSEIAPPHLEMSSVSGLVVGQDVLAVGTPLSLQFKHSVTKGIVSALGRTVEVEGGYLQNLVQHDASINPGNSGGPLVNFAGQVVGINTLKATNAEALGFAIPIDVAIPIVQKIAQNGAFNPPSLGIYGFDAATAAYNKKTTQTSGVYVMNVSGGGAMEKAGVKSGDVITEFDGKMVSNMLELRTALFYCDKGQKCTIKVVRDQKTMSLDVTL